MKAPQRVLLVLLAWNVMAATASRGRELEWELYGHGGQDPVLVPSGCGLAARTMRGGGGGANVVLRHAPIGDSSFRFVNNAGVDVRVAPEHPGFSRPPLTRQQAVFWARGHAGFGFETSRFALRTIVWSGNVGERRDFIGFFGGHLRFGRPDLFNLTVSVLDGPECLFADCTLGVEAGLPFWGETLRVGGSLGVANAHRVYARGTVPLGAGLPRLLVGVNAGLVGQSGEPGTTFGLTLGLAEALEF